MYPILFSFGTINFYTHGLMMALGAISGGFLIFYLARKKHTTRKFLFDVLLYSLFSGIIGARIFYLIFYYYQFSNWHQMLLIWYGGLVSFGGILFGFLTAGLILKKLKENVWRWFDLGIIGLLLGWFFGRVGCFLSGDAPGINSRARIAIWGEIPVSLFEAVWSLILAAILFYLWRKNLLEKFGDGILFLLGLAGYGLGRFVIDFWRQDSIFFYLKAGQIGSLIIIFSAALIIYFYYLKKYQKGVQNA